MSALSNLKATPLLRLAGDVGAGTEAATGEGPALVSVIAGNDWVETGWATWGGVGVPVEPMGIGASSGLRNGLTGCAHKLPAASTQHATAMGLAE